jgi:uncharacterized membrane protein YfcA
MDWTVYWFMLPVCTVIASVAMFSGISGAALLFPVFLIGFPLLGAPPLTTVEAVGLALFLETSGFGTGVYRYVRRRLIDVRTARTIISVALPSAVLGSLLARQAPEQLLRLGYGVAMLALAYLLLREPAAARTAELALQPAASGGPVPSRQSSRCTRGTTRHEARRQVVDAAGNTYTYQADGLGLQRVFSGAGAVLAGMISTGVGEATLPGLVRRSHFPVAVAAATSTAIVASAVLGASLTHGALIAREGGLGAIPWNVIVWAVPGAVTGAILGVRLQGRVSEEVSRRFFSVLFALIGSTFLLAFTVFREHFV